jgi:predicted RNase H-like nuclease
LIENTQPLIVANKTSTKIAEALRPAYASKYDNEEKSIGRNIRKKNEGVMWSS